MNYTEYVEQKQKARERLGPGTLICRLSIEELDAINASAYMPQESKSAHDASSIPEEMHTDVVFVIKPFPGLRFDIKEEDDGPYMDI